MISYGGAQDHETSSADSEWGLRLTREDIQLKTDKSFIPSLEAVREHVMEYGALSSFAWSEFEHKMKHRAALFAGVANGTAPTKTTVDAALANVPPSSRYRLYGRNFELKQRQESAGANIEPPTLVEISRGVLAFCLDFEFDLQLAQAHLHWHINGHQIYEERRRNSGMPLSPHALSTLIAAFPQEIGKFNQHLIVRQRITLQHMESLRSLSITSHHFVINLHTLSFKHCPGFTDDMARHLNLLTELKLLDLSGTGLTDSGVADLFRPTLYDRTKGLKNLAHFSVSHCHVTITTFRLLRKLSSIKTIDLSCTNTKQSELESLLGFRLQDDDKDNVWFLLPQEEIEYNFPWFDNVDEKKLAGLHEDFASYLPDEVHKLVMETLIPISDDYCRNDVWKCVFKSEKSTTSLTASSLNGALDDRLRPQPYPANGSEYSRRALSNAHRYETLSCEALKLVRRRDEVISPAVSSKTTSKPVLLIKKTSSKLPLASSIDNILFGKSTASSASANPAVTLKSGSKRLSSSSYSIFDRIEESKSHNIPKKSKLNNKNSS